MRESYVSSVVMYLTEGRVKEDNNHQEILLNGQWA